jgi:hypothetical protein
MSNVLSLPVRGRIFVLAGCCLFSSVEKRERISVQKRYDLKIFHMIYLSTQTFWVLAAVMHMYLVNSGPEKLSGLINI